MGKKNKYGQYFTDKGVADFMVGLIEHSADSRVMEPSCGQGVFLDSLLQRGFTRLSACEIDPMLGNAYSFVRHASFISISLDERYDVIIGNPPYIRWRNLEPELKAELSGNELWNRYFNSLCDYQSIFILKSIEHLSEGGELIFICTEYWMNTTHSANLRDYMCRNGRFTDIYHFKEAPLFEGVTASFVVFRYIKSTPPAAPTDIRLSLYTGKGKPSASELSAQTCFKSVAIPAFRVQNRWILAPQTEQNRLADFERACSKPGNVRSHDPLYRIGEFCDIGNGMVSGLDVAFQWKDEVLLTPDEEWALIPVMKAKHLCPYKDKGMVRYIFLQDALSTDEFENRYPHFANHFRPYLEKLSQRYNYNKEIPYWQFVFPRNQRLFERPGAKIFIPCKERISNKSYFRFCYAPQGCYATQDVTALLPKPTVRESVEYLLAFLNNERVFAWLSLSGIIKGAIVEFSEAPLAGIPFRPIDWDSEREVRLHDAITREVNLYLADGSRIHIDRIDNHFNQLLNG